VVHQGQFESSLDAPLDNLGTYFSSVFEPVYLAGIAAGTASETGVLGYVYAFPIPQTLENINAFTLGAQTVNPDIEVVAVATASWCDPGKQAQAAQTLLDQGADVLTQHQDCTKTVIEAAEAAGAYSVGYHYDASALAPTGWLTGSDWAWTDLYADIITTMVTGDFVASPYNGDYRIGYRDVDAPFVAFVPSKFGPAVSADAQAAITAAYDAFFADADGDGVGDFSVFSGPLSDRDGAMRIEEGVTPDYTALDGFFSEPWFVPGVEGSLG
jgi:simple sugar transport system substrate-binding protein/basic membrane protein A